MALDVMRLLHMVFASMTDWSENGKREHKLSSIVGPTHKHECKKLSSWFREELISSHDAIINEC